MIWHIEYYDELWRCSAKGPQKDPGSEYESILFEDFIIPAMRRFCFQQADYALEKHGLRVDVWSRIKLARAIGAALQKSSKILAREAEGTYDENPPITYPALKHKIDVDNKKLSFSAALDQWKLERFRFNLVHILRLRRSWRTRRA